MERRPVIDKRHVKLEKVLKKDYIPYMEGRPNRITVIGQDDVLNLSIALNTSSSLDDFIARI